MKKLLSLLILVISLSGLAFENDFVIIKKNSDGKEKITVSCTDSSCKVFDVKYLVNEIAVNENTIYYADILKTKELKVGGGMAFKSSYFWLGDNKREEGFLGIFSRMLIDGTSQRWASDHKFEVVVRYALTPAAAVVDLWALALTSPYIVVAGVLSANPDAREIRAQRRGARKMYKILSKLKSSELRSAKFDKIKKLLMNFELK